MSDTPAPAPDPLLTVADVAHRLNVPLGWVYAAASTGTLPAMKLGRYVRFSPAAINEYLASAAQQVRK